RRHTRSTRDWSSDVCSSDLAGTAAAVVQVDHRAIQREGLLNLTPVVLVAREIRNIAPGRPAGGRGDARQRLVGERGERRRADPARAKERSSRPHARKNTPVVAEWRGKDGCTA